MIILHLFRYSDIAAFGYHYCGWSVSTEYVNCTWLVDSCFFLITQKHPMYIVLIP